MAGLPLLLGLLACAPLFSATQPPSIVLTEMCYYPLNVEHIQRQLENVSLKMMSTEGEQVHILRTSNKGKVILTKFEIVPGRWCPPKANGRDFLLKWKRY